MYLPRARRATRACIWCQQRKVRCDASFGGCPCSRCLQDGQACTFRERASRLYVLYLIFSHCIDNIEKGPTLMYVADQKVLHTKAGIGSRTHYRGPRLPQTSWINSRELKSVRTMAASCLRLICPLVRQLCPCWPPMWKIPLIHSSTFARCPAWTNGIFHT